MFSKEKILFILGTKNSGKTSSIEYLIEDLTNKGIKVGAIKFTHKEVISEDSKKDTARLRSSGSAYSFLVTPIETSLAIKREKREKIGDIINYINQSGDLIPKIDILICESLNNPPENSKIVLFASNKNDLEKYYNPLQNPEIMAISGKISKSNLKNWRKIDIIDLLLSEERKKLVKQIIDKYGLKDNDS